MVNRPKGLGTSEATRRSEAENTVGQAWGRGGFYLSLSATGGPGRRLRRQPRPQAGGGRPRGSQGLAPEMEQVCWGPCQTTQPQIIPSQRFLHPARPQPEQTNNPRGRSA